MAGTRTWGGAAFGPRKAVLSLVGAGPQGCNDGVSQGLPSRTPTPDSSLTSLSAAQVPDSDEQFVPDFHSENRE